MALPDLRAVFRRDLAERRGSTGSAVTYRLAGDRERSQPIIHSLEQQIAIALQEPPLVVRRADGGDPTPSQSASIRRSAELLTDDVPMIAAAAIVDAIQCGWGLIETPSWPNAAGGANGRRERDWRYLPASITEPELTGPQAGRVDQALRAPTSWRLGVETWTPEEVVLITVDRDPYEPWRGRSTLAALGMTVFAEFHALQLQASALANAPAGYVATLKRQDQSGFRRVARAIAESVTGRNRGSLAIQQAGMETLQRLEFEAGDVSMNAIQTAHEANAAAAAGVPGPVAGGLIGAQNSTYDNFRTAERIFYRSRLRPLWRAAASSLTTQWLRRQIDDDPALVVDWDLTSVQGLWPDRDAAAARLTPALLAGALTLNTWLEAVGLDSLGDRGDVLRVGQDWIPIDDVLGPEPSDGAS